MPIQKMPSKAVLPTPMAAKVKLDQIPTVSEENLKPLTFLTPDMKLLLAGDTGAGKTAQIGLLAEFMYIMTGKPTELFTMDEGGILTIDPYIKLGVINVHLYDGEVPPWIWIAHALKGEAKQDGKWVKVTKGASMAAYEGLTAFSEFMLQDLSEHSANNPGSAVGGDSAWSFSVTDGDETLKLASNTMSHYGLVQLRIMHELFKARPGVPSFWTALLTRSSDPMGGGVLGPQTVGNKQAPVVPRWFDLTFRINAQPQSGGMLVHELFLETHQDQNAKGAKVIANARLPLAGSEAAPVLTRIIPASVVEALQQIQRRHDAALTETKARLDRLKGKRA